MFQWRVNPYVLVITIISIVALSMVGLLFILLPGSAELIRIMQWRMSRVATYHMETDAHYVAESAKPAAPDRVTVDMKSVSDVDRTYRETILRRHAFNVKISTDAGAQKWAGAALARGKEWRLRLDESPETVSEVNVASFAKKS